LTRIAKTLNDEGIRAPRGGQGWAPSCIREILHRPLYKGEIVWNEHEKIVRGGTKQRRRRSENEWIRLEAPELQIIPFELWNNVHARLGHAKKVYLRWSQGGMKGQIVSRPGFRDLDSPYLLTGMARCAHCNGPMMAFGKNYSGKPGRFYGCGYYRKRGKAICANAQLIDQETLDQALLKAITDQLDTRLLEAAVERALQELRSGQFARLDRRTAIERELGLIETHERHLVDAIARGEMLDPLLAKLKAEETRKKQLTEELEELQNDRQVASLDKARIKHDLRSRLAEVHALLGRHIPQARQILKKLIEQPLKCEAVSKDGQAFYRLTGEGNYLKILPTPLLHLVWRPQRDFPDVGARFIGVLDRCQHPSCLSYGYGSERTNLLNRLECPLLHI
jgi:hypothetical protein